jgi:hypothetical protein
MQTNHVKKLRQTKSITVEYTRMYHIKLLQNTKIWKL